MQILPIKTSKMLPPKDDLYALLDEFLPSLQEKDVVCITSKVLAIHQGRCIPTDGVNKRELSMKEADRYVPIEECICGVQITIKDSTLIASAGIDESNANGNFILWPDAIPEFCKEAHAYLCDKHGVRELGIIVTDSHILPLRKGVVGVAIGFYGFNPLKDYRGTQDLFGREVKLAQGNLVDGLAATAVTFMGESDECIPLVVLRDCTFLTFNSGHVFDDIVIIPEEDIFYPLMKNFIQNT